MTLEQAYKKVYMMELIGLEEQRNIIYAIKRVPFRYAGRYFEVVDDKLIVKMVPEKSFLEI